MKIELEFKRHLGWCWDRGRRSGTLGDMFGLEVGGLQGDWVGRKCI